MLKIQNFLFLAGLIAVLTVPISTFGRSENSQGQNSPKSSSSVAIVTSASASADNDLNHGAKNWKEELQQAKQAKEAEKLEKYKNLAQTLIQNRITLLENLRARIQENSNISQEKITELLADIDQAIVNLNNLKAEVQNASDLTALKEKIKLIFRNHLIYSVVAPRNLGQGLAAQGQYIMGRLQAIQRQMEQIINQNKNQGKDMTQLEQLMIQVTNQLQIAKDQLAIAEEKFKSMTPANTDTAKTARQEGKEAMRKAKEALKEAHRIMKQISEQLRIMGSTSPSSTTSISPSISPSATPTPSPSGS